MNIRSKCLIVALSTLLQLSACSDENTESKNEAESPPASGSDDDSLRTGIVNPSNAGLIADSLVTANASILAINTYVNSRVDGSIASDCNQGDLSVSSVGLEGVDGVEISLMLSDCLVDLEGLTYVLNGSLKYSEYDQILGGEKIEIPVVLGKFSIKPTLEQSNFVMDGDLELSLISGKSEIESKNLTFSGDIVSNYRNLSLHNDKEGNNFESILDAHGVSEQVSTESFLVKGESWYCLSSGKFGLKAEDESFVSVVGISGNAYINDLNGLEVTKICPSY